MLLADPVVPSRWTPLSPSRITGKAPEAGIAQGHRQGPVHDLPRRPDNAGKIALDASGLTLDHTLQAVTEHLEHHGADAHRELKHLLLCPCSTNLEVQSPDPPPDISGCRSPAYRASRLRPE